VTGVRRTPSTVTRLADRLVAAGHVMRGSDPGNRAVVTLELTDSGRNLVARVVSWRRQPQAGGRRGASASAARVRRAATWPLSPITMRISPPAMCAVGG
jgi:DNA-binding MarR family transcriptional regulator